MTDDPGHGGYDTSIHAVQPWLRAEVPECTSGHIVEELRQLHRAKLFISSIGIRQSDAFGPWRSESSGEEFFNDFRLLVQIP